MRIPKRRIGEAACHLDEKLYNSSRNSRRLYCLQLIHLPFMQILLFISFSKLLLFRLTIFAFHCISFRFLNRTISFTLTFPMQAFLLIIHFKNGKNAYGLLLNVIFLLFNKSKNKAKQQKKKTQFNSNCVDLSFKHNIITFLKVH